MPPLQPSRALLPLAAALSLALAGCGGGGGGSSTSPSSTLAAQLQGAAIDAPIAGAQITITAGAPLGDAGATSIGTATANASGTWSVSVTLPSGSVPVFANATSPTDAALVLSSYIGQSDVLAAAGTLTTANLPDLDVSPVTTAALAVYAQTNGGSFAALTPTTYAATLQSLRTDILVISAAIKAVGDGLCTPSTSVTSTTNLAAAIAAAANLSSATPTTLSAAATALGGNCATSLASLQQLITDDPHFGPELDLGDVIDAGASTVPSGTYLLQGVVAESGLTSGSISAGTLASGVTATPASVFTDTAVTVDAAGNIASSDGKVTGTLVGNLATLTVIDGAATYSLRGKIGAVPTALVSGSAYAVQAGGANASTGVLTGFEAVLAPASATPVWNGIAAPSGASQQQGVSCSSGQPLRLDVFVPGLGGGSLGECLSTTTTGWTMTSATAIGGRESFDDAGGTWNSSTTPASLSAPSWTEQGGAPFVLSASGVTLTLPGSAGTLTGTAYYVMGTQSAVLATSSANALLNLHDLAPLHLSEGMNGASQQRDH